jgi:hypothetical protein
MIGGMYEEPVEGAPGCNIPITLGTPGSFTALAGYHDYGAYSYGDLSAAGLVSAASAQIQAARAKQPLASLGAESYDQQWMRRPTNNAGAYLRVAYWLGAGARPSGRGGLPNYLALSYAESALLNANAELGRSGSIFSSEDDKVDAILADGEAQAKKSGRVDVAAILNQARGAPDTNQGWLEWLLGSADARARFALSGTALAAIGSGIALVWVTWPWLPNLLAAREVNAQGRMLADRRASRGERWIEDDEGEPVDLEPRRRSRRSRR